MRTAAGATPAVARERKRMKQKSKVSTAKAATIIVIVVVFGIAAIAVMMTQNKVVKNINLSADEYKLLESETVGERSITKVQDKAKVDMINKTLSGEYREVKRKAIDNNAVICIANPMYKTEDYHDVDDYSIKVYHEDSEEGHVIYGEGIYIINSRTIGFWDIDQNNYWIGKKTDGKIDTDLIKDCIGRNN